MRTAWVGGRAGGRAQARLQELEASRPRADQHDPRPLPLHPPPKMWRHGIALSTDHGALAVLRLERSTNRIFATFSGPQHDHLIQIVVDAVYVLITDCYPGSIKYDLLISCPNCDSTPKMGSHAAAGAAAGAADVDEDLWACGYGGGRAGGPHFFSRRQLDQALVRKVNYLQCPRDWSYVPTGDFLAATTNPGRINRERIDAALESIQVDSLIAWAVCALSCFCGALQCLVCWLSLLFCPPFCAPEKPERPVRERPVKSLREGLGILALMTCGPPRAGGQGCVVRPDLHERISSRPGFLHPPGGPTPETSGPRPRVRGPSCLVPRGRRRARRRRGSGAGANELARAPLGRGGGGAHK